MQNKNLPKFDENKIIRITNKRIRITNKEIPEYCAILEHGAIL